MYVLTKKLSNNIQVEVLGKLVSFQTLFLEIIMMVNDHMVNCVSILLQFQKLAPTSSSMNSEALDVRFGFRVEMI